MKIEVLFPELCNLYGDNGNIQYLAASMPEAERVRTGNLETPRFTKEPVDLSYLGSMSESHQELAIRRLLPHAGVLRQYVESGGVLLATGNALELFGTYIQEGKRQIPALGLFPCHAVRDMEHRHNSMFLGTFGDMKIVGGQVPVFLFLWRLSPSLSPGYGRLRHLPRRPGWRAFITRTSLPPICWGRFWC